MCPTNIDHRPKSKVLLLIFQIQLFMLQGNCFWHFPEWKFRLKSSSGDLGSQKCVLRVGAILYQWRGNCHNTLLPTHVRWHIIWATWKVARAPYIGDWVLRRLCSVKMTDLWSFIDYFLQYSWDNLILLQRLSLTTCLWPFNVLVMPVPFFWERQTSMIAALYRNNTI